MAIHSWISPNCTHYETYHLRIAIAEPLKFNVPPKIIAAASIARSLSDPRSLGSNAMQGMSCYNIFKKSSEHTSPVVS
eukprot:2893631-Rhodomonas_salina.1